MKKRQKLLTDEQWELIAPLLPEGRRRKDNRGRPWASNRACFEGILWILQTGAAWRFLPDEYPAPATCWRRLKQWHLINSQRKYLSCSAVRSATDQHLPPIPRKAGDENYANNLQRPRARTTVKCALENARCTDDDNGVQ